MTFFEFIPAQMVLIGYFVFKRLQFENQRWVRAIQGGRRGSNNAVVSFVLVSDILANVFTICILVAILWFAGWKVALGLYVFEFVFGLIWGVSIGLLYGDRFFIWLLSSLLLWPAAIYLGFVVYQSYV